MVLLALLVLKAAGLGTGTIPSALFCLKAADHAADFELANLHNHESQSFILNLLIYIYTYRTGSVSLGNPN